MKRFKNGEIPELKFRQAIKKPIPIRCIQMNQPFEVETLEGIMKGKKGDWLVVGISGEMYPIEEKIFAKTYDLIKD